LARPASGQTEAVDPGARPGDAKPAKPRVVQPSLTQFENAPYPAEAERAAIEGTVVLKLTIDALGNVTAAEVREAAGHGFDEAAQQAALKFKFTPATKDGVPVASQILYKYHFTLKKVEPLPAAAPTHGELAGVLQVRGTDEPLAGLEIALVLPDGSERRAVTDGAGRFRLEQVPAGKVSLRVQAPGFDEFRSDEEVVAGEATEVLYRIAPESTGIEIIVEGDRPPREVTRRTIERREVDRIPGTSGDALRSLESLPGVARPPPYS
jgi:TonB family protein